MENYTVEFSDENWIVINDIEIADILYQDELIDYDLRDREDFIDSLIDWISEATKDKEIMKEDLKYLMSLEDEYIFSSISTNYYVAFSDNPEEFSEICEEILEINSGLAKFIIKDWADNIMFDGKEFESYEDGWDYIYQNIEDVDNAYDDVFVVEKG